MASEEKQAAAAEKSASQHVREQPSSPKFANSGPLPTSPDKSSYMAPAEPYDEANMVGDITFSEASLEHSSKRFRRILEANPSKQDPAFPRTERPVNPEHPLDIVPRRYNELDTDETPHPEQQGVAAPKQGHKTTGWVEVKPRQKKSKQKPDDDMDEMEPPEAHLCL